MKKLFLNICVLFELLCSCLLMIVTVGSFFSPQEPADKAELYHPVNEAVAISADSLVLGDSGTRVSVYDQGLQLWQGSYQLPQGWNLRHEVATDTVSGDHYDKFSLCFLGPAGEVIKSLGYSLHNQLGKREHPGSFEAEWQQSLSQGLSGLLDTYEYGELQEVQYTSINYLRPYLETDSSCQYLQAPLRGQKDGQAYEGLIRITNMSPEIDWLNNFTMSVTLCHQGMLLKTLASEAQMATSYEANPGFAQEKSSIHQAFMEGAKFFSQH